MNRGEQGQNPDDILRTLNDRVMGGEMDWGAVLLDTAFADEYLTFVSSSSQYVDFGNIHDIGASDSISVGVWFYLSSTPAANATFIAKSANLGAGAGYKMYYSQSDDKMKSRVADGVNSALGATLAGAATAYFDSNWHLFVMVIDRDEDTITQYMDGELTNAGSSVSCSSVGSPTTATTLQMGAAGAASFMDGSMSTMFIVNAALTKAQVYEAFAAGRNTYFTGQENNVGGVWPIDEGILSGVLTIAKDQPGTLTNSPTWVGSTTISSTTRTDIPGLSINYTPPYPMRVRAVADICWGRSSGSVSDGAYLELEVYANSGKPLAQYGRQIILDADNGHRGHATVSQLLDLRDGIEYTIAVRAKRRSAVAVNFEVYTNSQLQLFAVGNASYDTWSV
jgi:hypothetical protein